jgi:hypothetical protein
MPTRSLKGRATRRQLKQNEPVMRELEMTPLAADDVIAPSMSPLQAKENRRDNLARRDEHDGSTTDDERAKKAEGFLSPADLAAAFNLDFRPKGGSAPPRKQRQSERPTNRRRFQTKRKWGKWIFAIVLLLLIGIGSAAVALRPPWRNNAIAMSQQAVTWSKQKWAQFTAADAARPPTHNAATSNPSELDSESSGAATIPQTQPATSSADSGAPITSTADSSKAKWEQILKSEPDGKPAADANANYKQGTFDDTRRLYREALEAERGGDYANAAKKFEQIKEYPPGLRQHDLELQLARARQHLQ